MKRLTLILAAITLTAQALALDVVITIPDASAPRIVDAIAETHDYTRNRLTISPGVFETKAAFARRMLVRWIRDQVVKAEEGPAKSAAEIQIRTSIEGVNITTN